MEVVILPPVRKFLLSLDPAIRTDVTKLMDLLETYGHELFMPYAKPIGGGLWELRKTSRPHIRILYGFCLQTPILLVAVRKQRSALGQKDMVLARKRLQAYCMT
ncbi:MAG TPA: type II toxin-antitoxin system RelE/ParE family toxin [Candidatus Paceibacterota bacterium]